MLNSKRISVCLNVIVHEIQYAYLCLLGFSTNN